MKRVVMVVIGFSLLLLTSGCDDGSVTTSEVINSCSQISGTYSGTYNDNSCHGGSSSGTITNYTITNGCSAEIQGFIVDANGSITNIDANGNSFNVRINTPPGSTCGGITGSCNKTSNSPVSYNCSYTWDNGGNGTISVTKQ